MSIFEHLKRNKPFTEFKEVSNKNLSEIFFLLQFDKQGAFIEVVNKSGKNASFDYRQYSGLLRSITKSLQLISDRNQYTVDWENPDKRLYLSEHPYLIPQLLESGRFVNYNDEVITAGNGLAKLRMDIKTVGEDALSSTLTLAISDRDYLDFQFINEDYAWVKEGNQVFETPAIGVYFHSIEHFNLGHIPKPDFQKYLSLFFSYLENVSLQYDNYTVQRVTEPIKAKPALVFEKVDQDNSLYLRIGQLLPNTDIDFLNDYDLYRFALINEMEEIITVHPVEQIFLERHIASIENLLNKHSDKGRKKDKDAAVLDEDLFIIPEKVATEFIYKEIPSLLNEYVLIGSEKLKEYKINTNPPRLDVQIGHGIDFLEGEASLAFGDQKISLFDAINQFNKNRYIILSDGSQALVNEVYMQKLQRLFKKKKNKVEISFFDLPLVEELLEERFVTEEFNKARHIFSGFNELVNVKPKLPKVNAKLRPYQKQGYSWLHYLYKNKLGGCLADDMGLGKTLQTITLLAEVYAKDKSKLPTIIVMPKSLLFNWQNELNKFAPQLTHYTWYGTNRTLEEAQKVNIILTTYSMIRNDIQQWKEVSFLYVVLDESQAMKNTQSQIHKAVLLLQAKHRLALSGTPVENNLSELYALFRFLNPAMFGSAQGFSQDYLIPIQKYDNRDAIVELKKKIYPFILRRLKKDVLTELPDKIEQVLYVDMSPEQAKYYEQRRLFYKQVIEEQVASKGIQQSQFFVFQAMNELRQIASVPSAQTDGRIKSPKTELLMEQLEDAIANKHKVLVFANYLAAVEDIGEELNLRGIEFVSMTGSTQNRQQLVDKFQNDPDCKVFVLTLKTGGTGLNLTAADMVFIFDPWWNKSAENQAIDRAHRIGQNKKVLSYKLITLGTIEEKILKLQEIKSTLLESIISSDSSGVKSLSEEDIAFMLG